MATESNERLFAEFPEVTTEQWEAVINVDLKGADYNKKLVTKTIEGINIKPYYRRADLAQLSTAKAQPGQFPYVRGNHAEGNPWLVRQDFRVTADNVTEINKRALDVLNRGVESLGFYICSCCNLTSEFFSTLLRNIDMNLVEVNFTGGSTTERAFPAILNHLKQFDPQQLRVSIDYSPLSNLTLKGKFDSDREAKLDTVVSLYEAVRDYPNFHVLAVNSCEFNSCGASAAQELGYALSQAAEYLDALPERGLSIDELAKRIRFNMAISANFFMELAKFRAARLLWAKMVDAYSPVSRESAKMYIHAETSRWNQTVYDAYVNMLRSTTESMSAVIAGVDSLNVLPFDTPYQAATPFSERIARNQQLLLKEESYLDKIADPAAGSYYVETLTNSVAQVAWKLFIDTEEQGGYKAAFCAGKVQEQITAVANKRDMNFVQRRETILGTNQFPNFNEVADPKVIAAEVVTRKSAQQPTDGIAMPLVPYRGSQALEALRYRTDISGKRPKVFMLTLGNLAMRRARAQFACNFFAIAGFEVIDNIGFKTIDDGLKAAADQKSDVVVICSSDDEYATLAPEACEKLGNKAMFVVAGDPACRTDLEAKGINLYIHVKSNVLETLEYYQKQLNIF